MMLNEKSLLINCLADKYAGVKLSTPIIKISISFFLHILHIPPMYCLFQYVPNIGFKSNVDLT